VVLTWMSSQLCAAGNVRVVTCAQTRHLHKNPDALSDWLTGGHGCWCKCGCWCAGRECRHA
jgi:hypothetical protein